jgi:hypothetical protein
MRRSRAGNPHGLGQHESRSARVLAGVSVGHYGVVLRIAVLRAPRNFRHASDRCPRSEPLAPRTSSRSTTCAYHKQSHARRAIPNSAKTRVVHKKLHLSTGIHRNTRFPHGQTALGRGGDRGWASGERGARGTRHARIVRARRCALRGCRPPGSRRSASTPRPAFAARPGASRALARAGFALRAVRSGYDYNATSPRRRLRGLEGRESICVRPRLSVSSARTASNFGSMSLSRHRTCVARRSFVIGELLVARPSSLPTAWMHHTSPRRGAQGGNHCGGRLSTRNLRCPR